MSIEERKKLLDRELDIFLNKVKDTYHPQKVIIFGSSASGEITELSDLDIIIITDIKDDFWTRLKKVSKLCSDEIGMDVLIYTPHEFEHLIDTRTFFKEEIVKKGKVIYES